MPAGLIGLNGREVRRACRSVQLGIGRVIYVGEDTYDYIPSETGIALDKLGDETIVPQLIDLLASPNYHVREGVAIALGGIGDKRAIAPLSSLLDDPKEEVRRAAIYSVAQMSDTSLLPFFLKVVEESSDRIAVNIAARAIGFLGDTSSVPILIDALKRLKDSLIVLGTLTGMEPDYTATNVSAGIVEALEMLRDKRAIPVLQEILDDSTSSTIPNHLTPRDLVQRAITTLEKSST